MTATYDYYKLAQPDQGVDSGFVYKMLNLPLQLYTPLFAIARSVGWGAHRIEELNGHNKIIRPAYISLCDYPRYVPLAERKDKKR